MNFCIEQNIRRSKEIKKFNQETKLLEQKQYKDHPLQKLILKYCWISQIELTKIEEIELSAGIS